MVLRALNFSKNPDNDFELLNVSKWVHLNWIKSYDLKRNFYNYFILSSFVLSSPVVNFGNYYLNVSRFLLLFQNLFLLSRSEIILVLRCKTTQHVEFMYYILWTDVREVSIDAQGAYWGSRSSFFWQIIVICLIGQFQNSK